MKAATAPSFSRGRAAVSVGLLDRRQQQRPALDEELVQDLVLGVEVVVDEAVGDPRLVGDVGDAGRVEALAGEDADAASRIWRRLSAGGALRHQASHLRELRPARRPRGGDWRARAGTRAPAPARRSRGRRRRSTPRPAAVARTTPQGSTIAERPKESKCGGALPTWLGARTKSLVLDRPRPQQHLPVVAAGGSGEGGGDGEQAGAAQGEDPVELRESGGRSRRSARRSSSPTGAATISLARLLVLGLAVGDAAGVDVEHVDLAVDGEVLAVGADQDRGVEGLSPSSPRSEMLPASRWMPRSRAQPRAALRLGPSSGSAPATQLLAAGEQVPLLRQRDQLGAVGGRGADQALGGVAGCGPCRRSS